MPRPRLILGAALAVLTIVAFADLRHADFVQLDDPVYVSENPRVAPGLTASSVSWAMTTFHNSNWHPLTWLSYLTDVHIFGLNPGALHLVNLAFHVANTLLLFTVLTTMTGSVWRSAFASALFAVHPLHVESVAWISERKDVLSTCFWLLTMWSYVAYVRDRRPARYALVVITFALGLMAKPMLVTLPFVLLLLDWWPAFAPRASARQALAPRQLVLEKLPLFALAAASSVVTVIAQQRGGAVMSLEAIPLGQRVANAIVSSVTYLEKLIWPVDLAAFYPYRPASWSTVVIAAGVLLGITAVVTRVARRNRAPLVGWLWYLGTLVPVIGLVQVGRQAMADRYTYVPFIGLFIALAWAVPALERRARLQRVATGLAAVTIVVACTVVTRAQVEHWHSNQALWSRALAVTLDVDPGLARAATARLAIDDRHVSETMARFFRTDPAEARGELAMVLFGAGQPDDALTLLREEIRRAPGSAAAYERLARAEALTGGVDAAIASFGDAIRLDPARATAHSDLGRLLGERGQYDRAVQSFTEAVRLAPRDAAARCDLGLALAHLGRFDDAEAQYTQALAIDPKLPELHNNIGLLRAAQNRVADALPHFAEAVRLRPDYVEALRNVGVAHLQLKQLGDAAQAFEGVLKIKPNDETARKGLAMIRAR
jgi:Flp pilus assembly protein TadD